MRVGFKVVLSVLFLELGRISLKHNGERKCGLWNGRNVNFFIIKFKVQWENSGLKETSGSMMATLLRNNDIALKMVETGRPWIQVSVERR